MEIKTVALEIPEGANIIIGQTHFIKTAEDLYEVMVNAVMPYRALNSVLPFVRRQVHVLSGLKGTTALSKKLLFGMPLTSQRDIRLLSLSKRRFL